MVDYIITNCHCNFSYIPFRNVIELGKGSDDYSLINDDELIILTSDAITHEFIHYLLHKEFSLTVSKLFDTIGHFFYIDCEIMQRLSSKPGSALTWEQYINKFGIQDFYNHYHITTYDLIEVKRNFMKIRMYYIGVQFPDIF